MLASPMFALAVTVLSNALGFANVAPGQALPERSLPRVGGKPQPYLTKSPVTVFFFFTPGTKNGQLALKKLGELEKEFGGKAVSWVALVSGSANVTEAQRDAAEASLAAPLLRDEGDELYGALGIALTPVVGIADAQHRLLAYLPFHKLQYQDFIRAWVRFALGEFDQAQLDRAIQPPPLLLEGGEVDVATRYLRLAQKQRERGELDKALANTRKSLEHAELPTANALLGALLAVQGSCSDARPAIEAALSVEPLEPLALATKRACLEGHPATVFAAGGADGGAEVDGGAADAAVAGADDDAGIPWDAGADAGAGGSPVDAGMHRTKAMVTRTRPRGADAGL